MNRIIPMGILMAAMAGLGQAAVIAFDVSGGTSTQPAANGTVGFSFTVTNNVNLTALGFFDEGGDGLFAEHEVRVWRSGIQVATAIVPLGTVATLLNGFRFVDITPVLLTPGTYVIGAFAGPNADPYRFQASLVNNLASSVTYTENRFVDGNTIAEPTNTSALFGTAFFGPNLQVAEVETAVPEPGTFGLLGTGLILLFAGAHRPRNRVL